MEEQDPYETYNTYGAEWNEEEYIFYINGVETGRTDFGGTSQVPEYLIVDCSVNGMAGFPLNGYAGDALTFDSPQPTDLVVDYVRVYQYKSLLDSKFHFRKRRIDRSLFLTLRKNMRFAQILPVARI
ncbi:MAG: family 16 glycosylhydrolase [Clostridia bacterium]|nr:family 16 glycosylhydrolase [Clostridia bacterium]